MAWVATRAHEDGCSRRARLAATVPAPMLPPAPGTLLHHDGASLMLAPHLRSQEPGHGVGAGRRAVGDDEADLLAGERLAATSRPTGARATRPAAARNRRVYHGSILSQGTPRPLRAGGRGRSYVRVHVREADAKAPVAPVDVDALREQARVDFLGIRPRRTRGNPAGRSRLAARDGRGTGARGPRLLRETGEEPRLQAHGMPVDVLSRS